MTTHGFFYKFRNHVYGPFDDRWTAEGDCDLRRLHNPLDGGQVLPRSTIFMGIAKYDGDKLMSMQELEE